MAGHISPALEANEADIHTAYRWGPSQSHMATANPDSPLPIFLAFQPYVRSTPGARVLAKMRQLPWCAQVGWEEERLWRKGYTWALVMGLGWLPIIGCLAFCAYISD